MKNLRSILPVFALLLALLTSNVTAANPELAAKLQGQSVTIKAGQSQGSGVLITRTIKDAKGNDSKITFVLTAAHVVDGLRTTRQIIDPNTGTPRTVIEFTDASIVQEFTENGRTIGETILKARVIRFSNFEFGEDLALLEVRRRNFTDATTTFYLDETIPAVGSSLVHVGSLHGQAGSNSFTTGVVSQLGRVLGDKEYDQTTATAFPGSSGGGVFLEADARYIGMLVRGAGETFNLIVPARRLHKWTKEAKIEWAINPAIPVPSDEERAKIKVEDTGVVFTPGYPERNQAKAKHFPFLIDSEIIVPIPDYDLNPTPVY